MAAVNFASASILSRSTAIKPSISRAFVGLQSISVKKVSPAGIVSARTPVRAMGSSVSAEAFAGKTVYDFTVKDIAGKDVSLGDYKGKVLLFVNVASQCGLTNSNYKGLQEVYEKYKDRGLEILAFPSNQFGAQEPGSNDQIKEFACSRYKATFPLFDKVDVNGPEAAPVYQFLRSQKGGGILGDAIKWNFGKFLVDKEGRVVERYAPTTAPSAIEADIEKLL